MSPGFSSIGHDMDMSGQVILSAPTHDMSGTGSTSATPQPLATPCEFNTCPVGSPAEGFNASDSACHTFVIVNATRE